MTFSAVPFALQNGSHSADLFRQAVSSLVPGNGGLVSAGDLKVTATGTPSMNVLVGVGRAWIPGTNVGNVAGGNFSSQAMYYGQNEAAYTASVTTSDPINPRIDVVYVAVQDAQYSGSSNAGVIAVATGVPTSGATYPTNAPAIPANAIALAWINVAANAASILNANITQLAPAITNIRHVEYLRVGQADAPANTSWGLGSMGGLIDTASTPPTSQNYSNLFDYPANDQVRVLTEGIYSLTWKLVPTSATATFTLTASDVGGSAYGRVLGTSVPATDALFMSIPNMHLRANDVLSLKYLCATGGVTVNHRIKLTKVG